MSFELHEQVVTTRDGRDLEVMSAGPDDGRCLLWHSGTPSAAGIYPAQLDVAAARGLRFVTFSRPGYAASTARPGRSVGDVAGDVSEILDALGFDTCICAGQSGGGPHALACAALLPDRVLATATIAGVAPWPAEGLDWLAGMGPENVTEFEAAMEGVDGLTRFLEADAAQLRVVEATDVAGALGGLVGDADKRALTGAYAEFMASRFRRSVSTGIAGWRDDDIAFITPWGFDLAAITTPVAVWQGGDDRMVPAPHGAWLARHISEAEEHLLPAEGHLSLAIHKFGEVLDGLLSMAETAPRAAHVP
jgi:pimeloyl-ACP methyl ester carboxylesterase